MKYMDDADCVFCARCDVFLGGKCTADLKKGKKMLCHKCFVFECDKKTMRIIEVKG